MDLIIMRHGEAQPHAPSDYDRNLTEYGQQQALTAGQWLKDNGYKLSEAWVSPYPRAQQTFQQVQSVLNIPSTETVDCLLPGSSPDAVVEKLSQLDRDCVLIVSHNPMVSQLVNYLCSGQFYGAAAMGTASMAFVTAEDCLPGCCELNWLRHAPDFERAI